MDSIGMKMDRLESDIHDTLTSLEELSQMYGDLKNRLENLHATYVDISTVFDAEDVADDIRRAIDGTD